MNTSTVADIYSGVSGARWVRRAGLALLLLVVLAGAVGVWGVHSATVSRADGPYGVQVTYPQVARAGLDVPFRIRVRYPDPAPKSLTVAVSADYFRMFETQGFFPGPDTQRNDGRYVYFEYQAPPPHTMTMEYDAYVQPASQVGKNARIAVQIHGSTVASVSLHTWLVP